MTLQNPVIVAAINAVFALAATIVVALSILVMLAAFAYRFYQWRRGKQDDYEPSELNRDWDVNEWGRKE
jgi:chaperone required for assembly of F1-ATPase